MLDQVTHHPSPEDLPATSVGVGPAQTISEHIASVQAGDPDAHEGAYVYLTYRKRAYVLHVDDLVESWTAVEDKEGAQPILLGTLGADAYAVYDRLLLRDGEQSRPDPTKIDRVIEE